MESFLWRKEVKRINAVWAGLTVLWGLVLNQSQPHYYNVDTEKKIKGVIQEIKIEPRYNETSPFLIVVLEEKGSRQKYNVEISPIQFFSIDLHKGESLEVLGSVYKKEDGSLNIIARRIQFKGETFVVRDKHGFPAWRGGAMKQKGKRRGRGF